jgi:hypothetical protein
MASDAPGHSSRLLGPHDDGHLWALHDTGYDDHLESGQTEDASREHRSKHQNPVMSPTGITTIKRKPVGSLDHPQLTTQDEYSTPQAFQPSPLSTHFPTYEHGFDENRSYNVGAMSTPFTGV